MELSWEDLQRMIEEEAAENRKLAAEIRNIINDLS